MSKVAAGATTAIPKQKPQNKNANNNKHWKKRSARSTSTVLIWFGCALLLGLGYPIWWWRWLPQSDERGVKLSRPTGLMPMLSVGVVPNPIDLHHDYHRITTTIPGAVGNVVSRNNNEDKAGSRGTTNSKPITAGFVHLGKTAGSTLSLLLRNGCHSFVRPKPCRVVPNETATSRIVEAYYHVPDYNKLPASNHQIYILSLRDVYDRTVSSLLYHHPRNINFYNVKISNAMKLNGPIAYHCFPSLEVFASLLQRGNATDCDYPYRHFEIINDNCSELACAAIHGKVRHFIHLFFNYRNIYAKIPTSKPEKQLYVIRKERLREDWWRVNTMLGVREQPGGSSSIGSPPWPPGEALSFGSQRNITGITLPVSRNISDSRREQLCKALEPEYRVYFEILQRAENIDTTNLEDAREVAANNCPQLNFHSILLLEK